ncbi:MAG TPA: alpha/beta hydrolase [Polyangia bacterium]|nr:alpha/beta hydrolase [Polyangia bacterium]
MRAQIAAVLWMGTMAAGLAACDGIHDPSADGNLVPKTADEDPTIPSIALAGTIFHYETFGDPTKPVAIFLHGGPGRDYRDELRLNARYDGYALTDDHFVVMWDNRGAGLSKRHDCGIYTMERMDADLDALVDLVSPGRPVTLIGHSWGAMYATMYINLHPEKVAAAVLMEPGPLNGPMFEEIKSVLYDLNFFSEWLNDDVWDGQFMTPDDHARADYHRMLGIVDAQPKFHTSHVDPAPVWRLGAVTNHCLMNSAVKDGKSTYDFTDHLSAYTKRVLFIASAWDEVQGVAFQEKQRQFYPSSELVTIAESGHDMQWVQPAATLAAIHAYLSEVQ